MVFILTEQKRKPGRKRKAAPEEKSHENTVVPDVKMDEVPEEPANVEEPEDGAQDEPKAEAEEPKAEAKDEATDAPQPSKASQVGA